jgi:hypothetical protein
MIKKREGSHPSLLYVHQRMEVLLFNVYRAFQHICVLHTCIPILFVCLFHSCRAGFFLLFFFC